MRIKFIYLTLIVFLITGNTVKASQPERAETSDSLPSIMIAIQPMYAFISGLRVDVDLILNRNHSLQFSPVLFYSNNFSGSEISGVFYDSHRGAGFHINHRFYPGEGLGRSKFYVSHGPMWHYNYITWEETIPGTQAERYNSFHRLGWDVMIGSYLITADRILLDVYTGLGIRHSIMRTDAENIHAMNYNYWSPGYSGAILLFGFRLGFVTGKKSF
jgi:hypothetical protein